MSGRQLPEATRRGRFRRQDGGHADRLSKNKSSNPGFLRAIGWSQPAARAAAVVLPPAAATDVALAFEKFFTAEPEALAFASEMTAKGHAARVVYDTYDYCWSVEVYAVPNGGPGRVH